MLTDSAEPAGMTELVTNATPCEELRRTPSSRVLKSTLLPASCPYGQTVCGRLYHNGAIDVATYCATVPGAEVCKAPQTGPLRSATVRTVLGGTHQAQNRTYRSAENANVMKMHRWRTHDRAWSDRISTMVNNGTPSNTVPS